MNLARQRRWMREYRQPWVARPFTAAEWAAQAEKAKARMADHDRLPRHVRATAIHSPDRIFMRPVASVMQMTGDLTDEDYRLLAQGPR